jgi:hypothetical protein
MKLAAHDIETDLPAGWEGRITRRSEPPGVAGAVAARGAPGERTHPVVHLANFALPEHRGDYGSGAVDVMTGQDILIVLFEFGPEAVGQPLFARHGLPRALTPARFSPNALQRTRPGQVGRQIFFTEQGRAFSLYVVLGSREAAPVLTPKANRVLRATTIGPR